MQPKSNISDNAMIYGLSNVVSQGAMFLLLPFYSVILSKYEYGLIAKLEVYTFILCVFLSFSLDKAAQRLYFEYDREERVEIFSTLYLFLFIVTTSIFLVAVLLWLHPKVGIENIYLYAIGYCCFTVNGYLTAIYFQCIEKPIYYAIIKFSTTALTVALITYSLLYVSAKAETKILSELIVSFLLFPVHLYVFLKFFRGKFSPRLLTESIKYSIPLIPTLLISWVIVLSNRMFIEEFHSLEDVAVFSMAFKISSVILIVGGAINMAYTPYFYRNASENNSLVKLKQTKSKILGFLFLCLFLFVTIIPEIEKFVLSDKYSGSGIFILGTSIANFISVFNSFTFVLFLLQGKRTDRNFFASLIAALASLGLNYMLVPTYGVSGAVIASILSCVILSLCQLMYAKQGYYIHLDWYKYCLGLVIVSLYGYFIVQIGSSPSIICNKVFVFSIILLLIFKFYHKAIKKHVHGNYPYT